MEHPTAPLMHPADVWRYRCAIAQDESCYEVRWGQRPGTSAGLVREAVSALVARPGWSPGVHRLFRVPEDDLVG